MRFLADENFPLPSVSWLRQVGYDVAAVILDSPGTADRDILTRAIDEDRIVLTFDRDFGELVFRLRLPPPPGVVLFRFAPIEPTEPARYLLDLLQQHSVSLDGMFTVAEVRQIRQRPLVR